MKRLFSIYLFLVCISIGGNVNAQTDEQAYSEEFTYGVNFNTNAGLIGGLDFKWAKAIGERKYYCFGFGLVNVKHPKEYRFRNDATGNSFLAYKTNYLFVLRPFYGREFVLFRKAAEEGVHINAIFSGGPSLGMLKPYYLLYVESNTNPNSIVSVPYTKDLNLNQIYGVGNLSDGLNEMKFSLGLHAKAALSFEFGQIKNSVVGMETGLIIEKFAKEQQIMAFAENRSLFTSAFITLYYGRKY
jgi:hypothetical protein